MIICLEGIDGSGKSTQAARLVKALPGITGSAGAQLFKFPNKDTLTGKLIYEHLEGKWAATLEDYGLTPLDTAKEDAVNALVFQTLQLANRMEVATKLLEAAAQGDVVIDRYWASGFAYGRADGLDGDYLIQLHEWLPQPDLWILIDCDEATSEQRRPERRDRYEKQRGHLDKAGGFYRELWREKKHRAHVRWIDIDGKQPLDRVSQQVDEAISRYQRTLANLGIGGL